jgi:peptide deformylase
METSAKTRSAAKDRISEEEREQRRQIALRHVRQYPDPVLRRNTAEVTEFDEELVALVERMVGIMDDAVGVGLAAPQLGLLLRLFTYRFADDEDAQAVVNPVISWFSDEKDIEDEGCLSLGDLRVPVERSVSVKVEGKDQFGEDVSFELDGYHARVFQHEIDHLDGVLMMDRAATPEDRKAALNYLRPKP